MPELMNLMVQCTNAIIATVSAVGMLIFTLGTVWMSKELLLTAAMMDRHRLRARGPEFVMYVAMLILLIAGIVMTALIVT